MSSDSEPPPSIRIQAIPHVMESIFEKLNNNILFKCRLVSKSWAKEAGRYIGKQLDENECNLNALKALKEIQRGSDIGILLKNIGIVVVVPPSYNINDFPSQAFVTVTSLNLLCFPFFVPNFIAHLFPNLQSLYLSQVHGYNSCLVKRGLACSLEPGTLPKLLKMHVRLTGVVSQISWGWKSYVETLLEKAVDLESFVLEHEEQSTAATYINKVCSRNIKRIKYNGVQILPLFITALSAHPIHFPLETIDLEHITSFSVDKENIKLLLTRFSSTLRRLVLEFIGTFEMDFPLGVLMTNLCTLKINNIRGSLKWSELPQLKILILYRSHFEGIASSISLSPQFYRLQALTLFGPVDKSEDFIRSFVDASEYLGRTLQTLHLVMACVRHLLPVICTKLTKLNCLTLGELWGGKELITDQDLCGAESLMFTPPVETLSGPPLNEFYKNLIASAKESNHARGPNITNLKDLRFLALEGAFSEVSVLHGIVHCEKLRELILVSESCRTTRDSVVHLVLNADLKRLTRMVLNGERINHLRFAPSVELEPSGPISHNSIFEKLEMF